MQTRAIPWLWLCLILPLGCVGSEEDIRNSSEPELLALRRDNRKLTKTNNQLRSENIVLKSKLADLTQRERLLSKKVAEMQFELERLREQVRVLSDVPAQRDRYRAEAQTCKSQMARLQMEVAQLKAKLAKRAAAARGGSPGQNPRPVGDHHRDGQAE